jgi:hypothetical protein
VSRRAPSAPKPKPPASWAGRALVALLNGPRHRYWYFRDDAEQLRASAVPGQGWEHYRETTKHVQHPHVDATGVVWRWSPARSA